MADSLILITSYLADLDWIGDETPMTICDVRVSPSNSVKPNVGAGELADALNRVLPFTAKDDARPIPQCVTSYLQKIAFIWEELHVYHPVGYSPLARALQADYVSDLHLGRNYTLSPQGIAMVQSRLHTGALNANQAIAK